MPCNTGCPCRQRNVNNFKLRQLGNRRAKARITARKAWGLLHAKCPSNRQLPPLKSGSQSSKAVWPLATAFRTWHSLNCVANPIP